MKKSFCVNIGALNFGAKDFSEFVYIFIWFFLFYIKTFVVHSVLQSYAAGEHGEYICGLYIMCCMFFCFLKSSLL